MGLRFSLLLATSICFLSCSKTRLNSSRIENHWKCDLVEIEDGNGFIYFDTLTEINHLNFFDDSVSAFITYHYKPLGETFELFDSLKISDTYSIAGDELFFENTGLIFRIKHLSKRNLVLAYYDNIQYKLKTFYLNR